MAEAEERLAEMDAENMELRYKIQEAEAISREDQLMHQMMMKEQEEKFTMMQRNQKVEIDKQDVLVDKIQE